MADLMRVVHDADFEANHGHLILLYWILCSYVEFVSCFFGGFFSVIFTPLRGVFTSVFPLVDVGQHPPKSIDVCVPSALSSVIKV